MDTTRYVVALLAVVAYPPVLLFWLLVHPFVGFWRRLGLVPTYALLLPVLVGVGYGIYRVRAVLLAVAFGTSWLLVGLAAVLLVAGMMIEVRCRRQLSLATLVGIPELKADDAPGVLLTEGMYARMRHPRYAGAALGLIAVVLFANYLALYLLALISLPTLYGITLLEERELVARFGDAYRDYQRRVPRFLPRRLRG